MTGPSFLVLDIETILDPELHVTELTDDRLPSPPHHQIVAIGALLFNNNYEAKRINIISEGKSESEALNDFSRFLDRERPNLVTFNGRSFDMPVIAVRCLRHGIPFKYYYGSRDVRYRFSPDGHLDLMDYLADFGASKSSKLDIVAKLCGMPGKVGIDGKDVASMVQAGRLQEVKDYCLCDVAQTAGVFLRVQLVRGEIEREQYLEAMRGLITLIQSDLRTQPVAKSLNENRLMLVERDRKDLQE